MIWQPLECFLVLLERNHWDLNVERDYRITVRVETIVSLEQRQYFFEADFSLRYHSNAHVRSQFSGVEVKSIHYIPYD